MKNVVLCVDLNEDSLARLKNINDDIGLRHAKVHLVHIFEVQYYISEFTPFIFPTEEQYGDMEKSTLTILNRLGVDLGISKENLETKCFFARSKEEKMVEYLKKVDADLVVVATRGRHGVDGLFTSSMTDHLAKYSICDVLVLRPKK